MAVIMASTKVTGKNRLRSIEAARRKIKDDGIYLIRRHGSWFKPMARGYTNDIAAAGTFSGREARGYVSVEGLSVVPLRDKQHLLELEKRELNEKLTLLNHKIDMLTRGKSHAAPSAGDHRPA